MRTRATIAAVGCLALAGAAGAIAVGAVDDDGGPPQQTVAAVSVSDHPSAERQQTGSHQATDAEQRRFGVLRGPKVMLDPAKVAIASDDVVREKGVNRLQGHLVETQLGDIAIAPAADGELCYGTGSTAGCVSEENALAGRAIAVQPCSPDTSSIRVFGLLPDEASTASLRLANGSLQELAVSSNVYAAEVMSMPSELRFSIDGVETIVPIPIPASAASACSAG